MDVDEKFDKLQMERILKEDPESYAFYNAKRLQDRRLQKGASKAKKAPAAVAPTGMPRRTSTGLQI
jgi:hypothetical protein